MIPQAASAPIIRYSPYARIRIKRVFYRCIETDEYRHLLVRVDAPEMFEAFTHKEMAVIEQGADYRYDPDWFKEGKVKARLRSGVERLADIPERELPKVLWKWEYCSRFTAMENAGEADRSESSMETTIGLIAVTVNALDCAKAKRKVEAKRKKTKAEPPLRKDGKPRKRRAGTEIVIRDPPCTKTLRRWLAILEEHDWAPEALRDRYRYCGNRTPGLDLEVYNLMVTRAVGYAAEHRPTRNGQYELLKVDIERLNTERESSGQEPLSVPSKRRFYKEIAGLDRFWVYARRHTLEAAKRKFPMVGEGLDVTRIGQRVEMDEWLVDLQTLLIKAGIWSTLSKELQAAVTRERWLLYLAMDVASRCVLGMRVAPTPSAANAIITFQMAMNDKKVFSDAVGALTPWFMATGIGTIATDTGSAFYSDEFRRAVLSTGATFDNPPVGLPHLRGTVERMFGSLHTRLVSRFTGRTFENVVALGEYDAEGRASVPLEKLCWALVRYIVDEYHNRPHEGLGGETPRNAWIRLSKEFGIIPRPDRETQRAIFGIELTRTLGTRGIRVLGLHYQSRRLHDLLLKRGGIKMDVRLDPLDLGRISVKIGSNWVSVPCGRRGFGDVSLRTWISASADLRARFAQEAALVEPIVLAAVRDIEKLGRDLQEQANLASELHTAEEIERAEESLTIAFNLPDWGDDPEPSPGGDLLDSVIPVGNPPPAPVVEATPPPSTTEEQAPSEIPQPPRPARTYRMGSRKDK
jgi:putative transposase